MAGNCGAVDLCDAPHLGLDDNCDGVVDDGCTCTEGEVHACFKGDSSFRNVPGCHAGTQTCGSNGTWGACAGGVHATDQCFQTDPTRCHAIVAQPFESVTLSAGLGDFGNNATGTTFDVVAPAGLDAVPAVASGVFQPLQQGEYTVTFGKDGPNGRETCTFPLIVSARGLRVELHWEHTTADTGVDLDLHLHRPENTSPWGTLQPVPQDCNGGNCTLASFSPQDVNAPSWFSGAAPPDAVNWSLDPVFGNNGCYLGPLDGAGWQAVGMGCHNPRVDLQNTACDRAVTDPTNPGFCAPESINVDFPPMGQWFRIGVQYYSNRSLTTDVHPVVRVFCNGLPAAVWGPQGFYNPQSPVTFVPTDGEGTSQNRFWVVGDVKLTTDGCLALPIHADAASRTPYFRTAQAASMQFSPPYR
jgi:hypothetical protein